MTIGDAISNVFLIVFGFIEFLLRLFVVFMTFGLILLFADDLMDCQLWDKLR